MLCCGSKIADTANLCYSIRPFTDRCRNYFNRQNPWRSSINSQKRFISSLISLGDLSTNITGLRHTGSAADQLG